MPLTAVLCHWCGEPASWLKIKIPNPDRKWCKHCHQEIGAKTKEYFFCDSECMKNWVDAYHRSSCQKASE